MAGGRRRLHRRDPFERRGPMLWWSAACTAGNHRTDFPFLEERKRRTRRCQTEWENMYIGHGPWNKRDGWGATMQGPSGFRLLPLILSFRRVSFSDCYGALNGRGITSSGRGLGRPNGSPIQPEKFTNKDQLCDPKESRGSRILLLYWIKWIDP